MKVLITGGCGFLGSNIAAAYLAHGAEVVVIDAMFRRGGEQNLRWLRTQAATTQFTHHLIDLADAPSVDQVFASHAPFDYVCHLGGQVAMTTSLEDPRRDLLTNVLGTFNILEAMRRYSPDALLAYSSTNKVYGDLKELCYAELATRYIVPAYPSGFDESLPLDFSTPYGCSKGAADQYVRDWSRVYGLRTVIFRHSSIYGGRQYATIDQGWVGWFCQKVHEQFKANRNGVKSVPFTVSGSGKQVRDVLHASDLTELYMSAYAMRDQMCGRIFNIGGGVENSLSIIELIGYLRQITDSNLELEVQHIDRRKSDQDFFVADIGAARTALKWEPKVSAHVGVKRMMEWTLTL
jgi:CDP-paratose 2-epimerase